MASPLQPASYADVRTAQQALEHLRFARDLLASVGAKKAAQRVRRAVASTDGAVRHIQRRHAAQF